MTDIERKEHKQEYMRGYRATHRAEISLQWSAYRKDHCEELAAYRTTHKKEKHEWYMDNRDEVIARSATWKKEHPESGAEFRARHIDQAHEYRVAHQGIALLTKRAWDIANPEKVAIAKRKTKAKRRALGFIPLNQPFEGCNGHHVDRERVVYIPEVLHMSIRHNVWNGRNMDKINAVAFDYLSKQEVAQ